MTTLLKILRLVAVAAVPLATATGHAQNWPTKPVRLVAAFPPGTPGDVIARLIQPTLQAVWKQPVIVDNKSGAAGNIAASDVAHAKDEHTLLVGPDTILTINPHLYKKLGFDLRQALKPITYFASFNQVLVCHPSTGVTTLAKFSQLPASSLYASGGPGTPSHMTMELLLSATGTKQVHVPYKGPGPAAQDVLAGHVPCGFIVSPVVLPHLQTHRLVALAVSSRERSVQLPSVPTVSESGHAGFDATFFETLMAPASLPAALTERIQRDIHAALSTPAMQARLAEMDMRVVAGTPQESAQRSREDFAKWGKIAQQTQLQLD